MDRRRPILDMQSCSSWQRTLRTNKENRTFESQDSRSFSVIISIFIISGFNVKMVAVVFSAVFVSVVGVMWPSIRAAADNTRDTRMNGNDLSGLFLLRMWIAVAVMAVADAILNV